MSVCFHFCCHKNAIQLLYPHAATFTILTQPFKREWYGFHQCPQNSYGYRFRGSFDTVKYSWQLSSVFLYSKNAISWTVASVWYIENVQFLVHPVQLHCYLQIIPFIWIWMVKDYCRCDGQRNILNNNNSDRFMALCPRLPRLRLYQKKHSPTHHPDHHPIFISFFCLLRSIASSLFKLCAWQSFCTTSFHVLFGLPLGLEPSTSYSIHFFTQSVSSFRSTCPYQHNLLL